MFNFNSKKILSFLVLIFILNIDSSFASSNSLLYTKWVRAKIMEDFKEVQYENIFSEESNILLWKDNVNFVEQMEKNEKLNKIRQRILESKDELSSQKEVLTTRKLNLEETINQLDTEINTTNEEIASLNREVLKLTQEIQDLKVESEELQKEITKSREVLLEYIAHIYKKSNLIIDDNEVDSLKTILLSSWNISDILNDIHFSSILQVTWQSLIDNHRKLIKTLFLKQLDSQSKVENLKNARREEVVKRKMMLEKKKFREKILEYTKWQEDLFEQFVKDKESQDRKMQIRILQNDLLVKEQKEKLLEKYNCEYVDLNSISAQYIYLMNNKSEENTQNTWSVDEKTQDSNCIELNQVLNAETRLKSFPIWQKNVLSWPIEPTRWLSAYYKDPDYQDVVWSSHDAIDIRAKQWTDIVAPADWYVTFVEPPDDEWYAYVVLKHGDGFVTVYWHISEALVWKYDFVKAWEVFARSWWEFWTNWAWVMTTWPHLHFEVYKDKEYVDPLNYLDLTILWEDNIPKNQKYLYKYLEDFKDKYWQEYEWELYEELKTFTLSWETEVERQKDLLNSYAVWDFKNWDIWVEEAISWNIDPSFLMCIWLAETWLWRNLKTPYNVWNIWNTDSGATRDFQNARSWIYYMVRTLNNKYLWGYNEMSKLSRYWNKDGSIYASSPLNWQNNMVKCLTALKERSVPDNYNFRISE